MKSTARSTTTKFVPSRFSEDFSTAGPNRHIRSTSVYAPLIPTHRDVAINAASKGILLWNKSDPNEKPILETLEEYRAHIWEPKRHSSDHEVISVGSLDSDLDVSLLSLSPKHGEVADHCYVSCANCKNLSRVSCVNGHGCVDDTCEVCGAYGEVRI